MSTPEVQAAALALAVAYCEYEDAAKTKYGTTVAQVLAVDRAETAYRAAKAAAEPKLRTRAEVNEALRGLVTMYHLNPAGRTVLLEDLHREIKALLVEKTREPDPAPAPDHMTEAERAPHHGWQEHAVRDERRKGGQKP